MHRKLRIQLSATFAAFIAASATPASSHGKVLYVGVLSNSTSSVLEYEEHGSALREVGQITQGISQPFGLFVDTHGNLYAANLGNGTVTVYARGSSTPMRTLTGAGHPDAVTVARDGTVYVNDCGYCLRPHHRSAVLEFANGSSVPTRTVERFTQPVYNTGIALDAANNLYVAYYLVGGSPSSPHGAVLEFAHGSKHGRDLGIRVGSTGGLTIDASGDLVLVDQGSGSAFPAAIDTFPPGSSSPVSQIGGYAYGVALAARGAALWATDAFFGQVVEFAYPQGTVLLHATVPGVALGVAVGPS